MCCAFTVAFLQPVDFVAVFLFVIISDCCLLQKMSDSCICEPFFLNYNLVCNNLLEIKLTGVHMLYLCIFWLWWIKCVVCCLGPPLSKSEEALSFDWLLKDKNNSNSTQSRLQSLHIECLKYGYGFWLRKISQNGSAISFVHTGSKLLVGQALELTASYFQTFQIRLPRCPTNVFTVMWYANQWYPALLLGLPQI